jgi:hypothetical protein
MNAEEVQALKPGIYRLYWKEKAVPSLAAVGLTGRKMRWYAPCDWAGVPGGDWSIVERAELLKLDSEHQEGNS